MAKTALRMLAILLSLGCFGLMARAAPICRPVAYEAHAYTVCAVDVRSRHLALYLDDAAGHPIALASRLAEALSRQGQSLTFAMNAGMYEADLSPVGLFVAGGRELHALNTGDAPGNFFLKPNGVFFFGPDTVGILPTDAYVRAGLHPDFATQSGPMLVIDGAIHRSFQPGGPSQKIRNGVGIRDDHTAIFAISDEPVNFHAFATLFRDRLDCRNALFLDGTISVLYAPGLGRTAQPKPLGPMLAVTEPAGR